MPPVWLCALLGCLLGLACPTEVRPSVVVTASDREPPRRHWAVDCAPPPAHAVEGCTATTDCGRAVADDLFTADEARRLLRLVQSVMRFGGGSGGPTIYDLASGALSKDRHFIDIYTVLKVCGGEG